MKIALAQQNYHIGNFEENVKKIIQGIEWAKKQKADLVVFSELCICGYPPRDFLEFNDFSNWRPCHRSNFPVPGSRLRKRSGTSSFSTGSPPAVRPRDVNRRAAPANISCTARRTRSFGRVGAYNPRRSRFAAPASLSTTSRRRTATKSNRAFCCVERALRFARLRDPTLSVGPGSAEMATYECA